MTQHIRKTLIAAALAAAAPLVLAAGYPDKAVNYIIPFGPGGESDVSARLQGPGFKQVTGQGLAIQDQPGPDQGPPLEPPVGLVAPVGLHRPPTRHLQRAHQPGAVRTCGDVGQVLVGGDPADGQRHVPRLPTPATIS